MKLDYRVEAPVASVAGAVVATLVVVVVLVPLGQGGRVVIVDRAARGSVVAAGIAVFFHWEVSIRLLFLP